MKIRLDVMVAVYGAAAIRRVSQPGWLEPAEGVRYLVSWQPGDDAEVPSALSNRDDVVVDVLRQPGVSRNRNNLLRMATAPYLLCADDDMRYTAVAMKAVIEAMDARPDADVVIFKALTHERRRYPVREVRLGYGAWHRAFYPYAFEVALRRDAVERVGLRFDERFGTNAGYLGAGEEDVFCFRAWQSGLRMVYVPITILEHTGPSTIGRLGSRPEVLRARGAVLRVIYGRLCRLRMLRLAVCLARQYKMPVRRVYGHLCDGARYVSEP